jgi:hypothetical protein
LVTAATINRAGATVYTVNSLGDAGTGSGNSGDLRYCINTLNASGSATNTINFSVAGTITLLSDLPEITSQVTIDGYTAPGATAGTISGRIITLMIVVPGTTAGYGLTIGASNTVIRGIDFNALSNNIGGAVAIYGGTGSPYISNVWIYGCYFNTNLAGTASTGSGFCIAVYGNTGIAGITPNSNISGWIIGTDGDGINDASEQNLISHTLPSSSDPQAAAREPVRLFNVDNFIIAGNTFGLQKDGISPLQTFDFTANQNYGISMVNCTGVRIGTNGDNVSDALERNTFAGMRGPAIAIFGNINGGEYFDGDVTYTNRPIGNNQVNGNYFGTDAVNGTATGTDYKNSIGVWLSGTSFNSIGSASNANLHNIIVNSLSQGVRIEGTTNGSQTISAPCKYNIVAGNYIGVLTDGVTASGNGYKGILLSSNTSQSNGDTSVYKTTITKNIIANNFGGGVEMDYNPSIPPVNILLFDNSVSQNTIYNNIGIGINLSVYEYDEFATPNDGILENPPSTSLANGATDYGIITNMSLSGNNLTIKGYVGNTPAGNANWAGAVVEFFIADNSLADQDGERILGDGLSVAHGEGKTYLGSLTADANGLFNGTIDVTGKGVVAGTTQVTNTATEMVAAGSTSEFGVNVTLQLIGGTVFNDANGLTDNVVNGTGTNAGGLNAVLYNNSTGAVEAVVPVNSDGTYSFSTIAGLSYTVYITTNTASVAQTAVPVVALPAGWVNTGDNNCVNAAGCTGSDGTPNCILALGPVSSAFTQVNFGIDQRPLSSNQSYTIDNPAINGFLTLNGTGIGNSPGPLLGSDPEDMPATGSLTGKTIAITTLPVNGELWYNGVQITATGNITNYDPALLQVRFTGSGYTDISFGYAYMDAAGVQSATAATYTVSWLIPLPLKLISFTGVVIDCNVTLNWITAEEISFSHFDIEESSNGTVFTRVGVVKATGGAGQIKYSFNAGAIRGTHYYRLRMVDKDGKSAYSNIVLLRANCGSIEHTAVVYPNPAGKGTGVNVSLQGFSGTISGVLYAADGKRVIAQSFINGSNHIATGKLAAGMYQLLISDAAGNRETHKIIITQ